MSASSDLYPESDRKILVIAFATALVVEFVVTTAVGWNGHWLAHPQKTTGLDASRFLEAQVVELPKEAPKLKSEASASVHAPREAAISTAVKPQSASKTPPPAESKPVENKTEAGGPVPAPDHGPIAVYAPAPSIPSYLSTQEIKTSVVIEFFITAQGVVTPRLLSSSGNEELDRVALKTVSQWKFRAAEKDHKPIDSKVRLRIVFEVQ